MVRVVNEFKINSNGWVWDVFGSGELLVTMSRDVSWLMRLRARIFLGSKWTRCTES